MSHRRPDIVIVLFFLFDHIDHPTTNGQQCIYVVGNGDTSVVSAETNLFIHMYTAVCIMRGVLNRIIPLVCVCCCFLFVFHVCVTQAIINN